MSCTSEVANLVVIGSSYIESVGYYLHYELIVLFALEEYSISPLG